LAVFELAATFEEIVPALNEPPLTVPRGDKVSLGEGVHRQRGQQPPVNGVLASRWVWFADSDDVDRQHGRRKVSVV
jgi:hypothetical protein